MPKFVLFEFLLLMMVIMNSKKASPPSQGKTKFKCEIKMAVLNGLQHCIHLDFLKLDAKMSNDVWFRNVGFH